MKKTGSGIAPAPPSVRLCVGVTGHRSDVAAYAAHQPRIQAVLRSVMDLLDMAKVELAPPFDVPFARTRLHALLADGADQLAAREALARQWELSAILPFGAKLNLAINARPKDEEDARALLDGRAPKDPDVVHRAESIRHLSAQARLFELADDDDELSEAFLAALSASAGQQARDVFNAESSVRAALAARVLIEQSDIIIAIWDGALTSAVGGTGHTIAAALDLGAEVVWIDAAAPEDWRILSAPEALTCLRATTVDPDRHAHLKRIVQSALSPVDRPGKSSSHVKPSAAGAALAVENWRRRSNPLWHTYRRIEAVFGNEKGRNPLRSLRQTYETPEEIVRGTAAATVSATASLPQAEPGFAERIGSSVMARFAWADGISSYLSDTYRGGMIISFVLSALAVVIGVAYLPVVHWEWKWPFALVEFVVLSTILLITYLGQKRAWHARWFETRRVAEYLRHAHLLLALGAARAPGRWPRGAETSWPEHYARHALREVGLPAASITPGYLRHALRELLDRHVTVQRDYHHAKAKRLNAVHHNLDHLSNAMFQIAVASVAIYLGIVTAGAFELLPEKTLEKSAKIFTFLGVLLPTLGGAIAGIRYFGDFERFAAISEITAGKLDAVHDRIKLLLQAPDGALDYGPVSQLAHAADDIVASEIENWQAVFSGKRITVPV